MRLPCAVQVKDRFEFPLTLDMRQYTLEGAGALMVGFKFRYLGTLFVGLFCLFLCRWARGRTGWEGWGRTG